MFRTSIKIGGGEGMKTKKARRSREINALLATKAAATQITCVRLVQELNAAQLWLATRFSNIDHGLLVVLSRVYNCRCLTLVVLRTSDLTEEAKLSVLKFGNLQYNTIPSDGTMIFLIDWEASLSSVRAFQIF